ncbi:hypothetical protein KCV87_07865 [Actinosynnema pretiosum subsp. pretiosum]|uniref:Uncharacterized protein n=2 Tax=Actinosynnema TaxID=40566 RepID=C6WL18_ACTMD|nr:hypothetical protein [Actinosynnema mirum]ACU36371.1 hypothetical protein Amir_2431 [Actinosynnema mirum DSM 43827]AXX29822.1 hypothetical protein APASM_2457 [Actinosynnema pretiosum subsp. pretiosum]QUF05970.1 hypothetical protein KCV87_07865 [Actinosynnema pretiosum subsp. pretiosum]
MADTRSSDTRSDIRSDTRSDTLGDTRSGDYRDVLVLEARALAPRLFAIAYEYGDGEDGEIVAYGLQFPDHADATGVDDNHRTRAESAEGVRELYACFALDADVTTHVLWLDQSAPDSTSDFTPESTPESTLGSTRPGDISTIFGENG